MCSRGKTLAAMVDERMLAFPASGEINRKIADPAAVLNTLEKTYGAAALVVDHTDGLSVAFADWRFNVRMSNTEPVVRLNVESRRNPELMLAKTAELLAAMGGEAL
jgi:phosphomannomutase